MEQRINKTGNGSLLLPPFTPGDSPEVYRRIFLLDNEEGKFSSLRLVKPTNLT